MPSSRHIVRYRGSWGKRVLHLVVPDRYQYGQKLFAGNKRRAPTSTPFDAEEAESFEDAGLLHEMNTPENELMSKQVVDVVQASLQQLPEDLRSALTLREIEGLSYEELQA